MLQGLLEGFESVGCKNKNCFCLMQAIMILIFKIKKTIFYRIVTNFKKRH